MLKYLEAAQPLLKEKGIELKIEEFNDYVLPNQALDSEDIDANYLPTHSIFRRSNC